MSNEQTIDWNNASKKEIFEYKNKYHNAQAKIADVFTKFKVNDSIIIPDYVNAETDSYIPGGVLYSIDIGIGFMSNHTTMKNNLDIIWFIDEPMKHGDWTQKQLILSKLKGIEFKYLGESIQEYYVTPELTEEQEIQIVTGQVPTDAFDDLVKVYQTTLWNADLLVHKINDEMYFVEELPQESEVDETTTKDAVEL